MSEIGRFFSQSSEVHHTLHRLTKRLDELGIDYAICGGMAIANHGYYRTTDDVDLLVTPANLKRIHESLDGLGYLPKFRGSKHLRDVKNGVAIEFLETGQYPGDGKPKPVAFPDPAEVSITIDGVRYLRLTTLIELKLASGISADHRGKDLVDVQELITAAGLPISFADQLNEYVRDAYLDCWKKTRRRYIKLWRNEFLTTEAQSLEQMADTLDAASRELKAMIADGVSLDLDGGTGDDYAMLATDDPEIARKYDMHEESEYWGEGET